MCEWLEKNSWVSQRSTQPCMVQFWYKRDVFIIVVRSNKKEVVDPPNLELISSLVA